MFALTLESSKSFTFAGSYNPALNPLMVRPPIWPAPPAQAWYPQQAAYPQQPAVSVPSVITGLPQQPPLFPIQNVPTPMTSAPVNVLQTSFPMAPPGVPSPVAPQASQPLFPVNTSTVNGAANSPFLASVAPVTIPVSSPAAVGAAGIGYGTNNQGMLIL